MQNRRYPMWKQLLAFALAGPPVGSLVLFAGFSAPSESAAHLPTALGFWLQMTLPLAYITGLVPAVVAGITGAMVRARVAGRSWNARFYRFVVPVLVGAAASTLVPLLFLTTELDAWLAAAGAVAAFACTAWVEWRASVHPNNSFKGMPLRGTP